MKNLLKSKRYFVIPIVTLFLVSLGFWVPMLGQENIESGKDSFEKGHGNQVTNENPIISVGTPNGIKYVTLRDVEYPDEVTPTMRTISGVVMDDLNDVPIEGAIVEIFKRKVMIDSDGTPTLLKLNAENLIDIGVDGKTNYQGIYKLDVPFYGNTNNEIYLIRVKKEGFEVGRNVIYTFKKGLDSGDIYLTPQNMTPIEQQRYFEKKWFEKVEWENSKNNEKNNFDRQYKNSSTLNICNIDMPNSVYVVGLVTGECCSAQCNPNNPDGVTMNMDFDDYIAGVVEKEVGYFNIEAKKANAVAARAISMYQMAAGNPPNCRQAYDGNPRNSSISAANETAEMAVFFNGEPADASYAARCNSDYTQAADNGKWDDCEEGLGGSYSSYRLSVPCTEHYRCTEVSGETCCVIGEIVLYGHGVGLCQRGANDLAADGHTFDEIIHHYFTDVEITNFCDCPNDLVEPDSEEDPQPFGNLLYGCSDDVATGYLCRQGDADYFRMDAAVDGEVTLTLSGVTSGLQYSLELYEYDGNEYVFKTWAYAQAFQDGVIIYDEILQGRNYLVVVSGFGDVYNENVPYTLSLYWEATPDEGLLNNSNSFAPLGEISATSTNICVGASSTLSVDNSYANVRWYNNDNDQQIGAGTQVVVSPDFTTTYRVEFPWSCNGPDYTETITIYVTQGGQNVTISPSSPSIYEDESVLLSASSDGSCQWIPSTGLSNPNSCSTTASPTSTTTYTVTVNDGGCTSSASVIVNVIDDDGEGGTDGCTAPNDTPCNAIELEVYNDLIFTQFNNFCATDSDVLNLTCDGTSGEDVWYKLIMPDTELLMIIMREAGLNDLGLGIYKGNCNSLTYIGCVDSFDGTNVYGQYMPFAVIIEEPGTEVYLRVWDYLNDEHGTFDIAVWDLGLEFPDLVLSIDDISDSNPNQDETVTVEYTICNNSNVPVEDVIQNNLYLSTTSDFSGYFEYLSGFDINFSGLDAFDCRSFFTNIYFPPELLDAQYIFLVTTDLVPVANGANSNIYESLGNTDLSRELDNNFKPVYITLGDAEPIGHDFTIGSFDVSPDDDLVGGQTVVDFDYWVRNHGNIPYDGPVKVWIILSEDSNYDEDEDIIIREDIFYLDAGDYDDIEGSFVAPVVPDIEEENWRFIAIINPCDELFEYDKGNNDDKENVTYNIPQTDYPDYRGYNMFVEQYNILTNDIENDNPFKVGFTITNDGDADANLTTDVRLYRMPADNLNDLTYIDTRTVPSLDVGQSVQLVFDITNNESLLGSYVFAMEIDEIDVIDEGQYNHNNTTLFPANFIVAPDTLLPVEMLPLKAYVQDKMTILEWSTEIEINNAGFEIQRSRDGTNFEKIDWVDGYGNTTTPQSYRNHDENPYLGKSYYRLKQIDFDGAFAYSNIVSVTHDEHTAISVYPNPVKDMLHISGIEISRIQQLTIYDTKGRAVQTNSNFSQSLDLSDLPSGMYILEFIIDSGVFVQKIVVTP